MAYSKQTWNPGVSGGTPLSATALNYMEAGIAAADSNQGSGTSFPLAPLRGNLFTRTDYGVTFIFDGTNWQPVNPSQVYGKLWRTLGFSGNMNASTDYSVIMESGRVSGGFTQQHDTSGTAWGNVYGNSLTVPLDGLYRITARGYATGGPPPYDIIFYVMRGRTSVADLQISTIVTDKTTGNDRMPTATDTVPLKAGDKLAMRVNTPATGPNYWGNSEVAGVMLSAFYEMPLNGAVPV